MPLNQNNEPIPDITSHEMWLIQSTLNERYSTIVKAQQVDVELRLSPADRDLTICPAVFWEDGKCRFIIAKTFEDKRTGNRLYYSQFFYSMRHNYGTEEHEHKDLGDCVVNLLKLQEDFEKQQQENPEPVDLRGVAGHNEINKPKKDT
jgi:hypothetical protein